MRIFKRSFQNIYYLKKTSIINMIVIILLIALFLNCFSVFLSLKSASNTIRKSVKTEFQISEKNANNKDGLTDDSISLIKHLSGVTSVTTSVSNFLYDEQSIKNPSNILQGETQVKSSKDFLENNKLISGVYPESSQTRNPVLISKKFAQANKLNLGERFSLYASESKNKSIELTVVGIFQPLDQNSSDFLNKVSPTSDPNNKIYSTITTSQHLKKVLYKNEPLRYSQLNVKVNGLTQFYQVLDNIKSDKRLHANNYFIEADYTKYRNLTSSIDNTVKVFYIILSIIGFLSLLILVFLKILFLKPRKYEFNVLRALGESNQLIDIQVQLENLYVFLTSFGIALLTYLLSKNLVIKYFITQDLSKNLNDISPIVITFLIFLIITCVSTKLALSLALSKNIGKSILKKD